MMNLKLTCVLVLIFNFFCETKISAQQKIISKSKTKNFKVDTSLSETIRKLKLEGQGIVKQKLELGNYIFATEIPGMAQLVSVNKNFDIYKLPLDNMPCLVPNDTFYDRINVMSFGFNNKSESSSNAKMPNRFKIQELIRKDQLLTH